MDLFQSILGISNTTRLVKHQRTQDHNPLCTSTQSDLLIQNTKMQYYRYIYVFISLNLTKKKRGGTYKTMKRAFPKTLYKKPKLRRKKNSSHSKRFSSLTSWKNKSNAKKIKYIPTNNFSVESTLSIYSVNYNEVGKDMNIHSKAKRLTNTNNCCC